MRNPEPGGVWPLPVNPAPETYPARSNCRRRISSPTITSANPMASIAPETSARARGAFPDKPTVVNSIPPTAKRNIARMKQTANPVLISGYPPLGPTALEATSDQHVFVA